MKWALGFLLAAVAAFHVEGAAGRSPARGAQDAAPGPGVQESSSCARCHSNAPRATAMRDADGAGIAPYDLWRSTMMANAARDPLWRAVVSAEVAAAPQHREEIERTCLACHAPMAARVGLVDHDTGTLMHVLDCDSDIGELARDGVSCTICHGMSAEGLGTEESFTAGFQLDVQRRLFGPHAEPFPVPMQRLTGFTPTHGEHVLRSASCGSCHTLITDVLDAEGRKTGHEFLEQAPYLEWRNSAFNTEGAFSDEGPEPGPLAASCQDCHLPVTDDAGRVTQTRIARNPGGRDFPFTDARSPYGRHLLVGGNTLVLSMLRDHADELRVEAPPEAFDRTIAATRDQLRNRSAHVSIDDVHTEEGRLAFRVTVENLTGHKLPTAHPTRRAWLRVVVRGADGEVLFRSGAVDARGRLVDANEEPLPSELAGGPVPPHVNAVRGPDEVARYRAVMSDTDGRPTHTLLRGARWLVDDRLLPKGWRADHTEAVRTAPVGTADDEDFRAGFDDVRYDLALPAAARPTRIEAELLYQTLSARWAAELFEWETEEVATFRRMYEAADLTPEVLAGDVWGE